MKSLKMQKSQRNFEAFTDGPKKYLGYILLTLEPKRSLATRVLHLVALTNCIAFLFGQVAFVAHGCGDLTERYAAIIFVNYYCVALGKHFTMCVYRLALKDTFDDFNQLSPSMSQVHQYGLQKYYRNYKYIERFIHNFFVYICLLYSIQPILQSIVMLWLNGEFGYAHIAPIWPVISSYAAYVLHCPFVWYSSWFIGFSIVSADVSLLSCITQLCAHFDLIAQRIMEMQPEKEESLQILNEIIKEHQKVLKLARKVNSIFAPSIASTLTSSSFIICFVAYQMLDDVSLIEVAKAFILLIYESKQIILICYYSNKLMDMSLRVFDASYMHEWYNGSVIYRRHIAFLLMSTRQPVTLRIAGTTNISLIILKQVFSNAYQIFAVLKTT